MKQQRDHPLSIPDAYDGDDARNVGSTEVSALDRWLTRTPIDPAEVPIPSTSDWRLCGTTLAMAASAIENEVSAMPRPVRTPANRLKPSPVVAEASDGDLVFAWSRLPSGADGEILMQRVSPKPVSGSVAVEKGC